MGDGTGIEWTDTTCRTCQRIRPQEAFAVDRSRARGRAYVCRECANAAARSKYTRRGHPGRRGWLAPTRDGDRRQARRRVNYLVEQGLIPKPGDLGCMDCGDGVFIDGGRHEYDHARGYDGANQLYVEPVCRRCHENREAARG